MKKEAETEVPVVLYKMDKKDLLNLDLYEEIETGLYYKKRVVIFMNKRIYLPVIYIMNKTAKPMKPEQTYVNKIYKGYEEYSLDKKHIEEAIKEIK